MLKCVFSHLQITMTQINLRIHAVWSGPPLFANKHHLTLLNVPVSPIESKCPDDFAHVQDDVNPLLLRMLKSIFFRLRGLNGM